MKSSDYSEYFYEKEQRPGATTPSLRGFFVAWEADALEKGSRVRSGEPKSPRPLRSPQHRRSSHAESGDSTGE